VWWRAGGALYKIATLRFLFSISTVHYSEECVKEKKYIIPLSILQLWNETTDLYKCRLRHPLSPVAIKMAGSTGLGNEKIHLTQSMGARNRVGI
jgi:hypothetical protein